MAETPPPPPTPPSPSSSPQPNPPQPPPTPRTAPNEPEASGASASGASASGAVPSGAVPSGAVPSGADAGAPAKGTADPSRGAGKAPVNPTDHRPELRPCPLATGDPGEIGAVSALTSSSAYDIGQLLAEWPYKPGPPDVRRFLGGDGQWKLQLRCPLGLLQMNLSGRPDGQRPFGFESLLSYHRHELHDYRRVNGNDAGFHLTSQECSALRFEMQLYLQRAVALLHEGDYPTVVRDTVHNLRIADLCRRFAISSPHRHVILSNRPRMLTMRTHARASLLLKDGRPRAAYATVRRLITRLENISADPRGRVPYPCLPELMLLQMLANKIRRKLPIERVRMLRKALERAIAAGRYEEAARLRNQIAALTTDDGRPPRRVDPR